MAPLFKAIKVCHDLWTHKSDNTFLNETTKCSDNPTNGNCYYHEKNSNEEEMNKEYDDLDEDEDAFGAKSRKIVVQL